MIENQVCGELSLRPPLQLADNFASSCCYMATAPTFEPQLIGKHERRLTGIHEKIIAIMSKLRQNCTIGPTYRWLTYTSTYQFDRSRFDKPIQPPA